MNFFIQTSARLYCFNLDIKFNCQVFAIFLDWRDQVRISNEVAAGAFPVLALKFSYAVEICELKKKNISTRKLYSFP